jgi:hypothetical protein
MGGLAGHTVWRDPKLRAACQTTGEPSGDTSSRRRQRKKPGIDHRALPSRHRIVRKTHRLRWRTRCESSAAQPGEAERPAVQPANGQRGKVSGPADRLRFPCLSGRTALGLSQPSRTSNGDLFSETSASVGIERARRCRRSNHVFRPLSGAPDPSSLVCDVSRFTWVRQRHGGSPQDHRIPHLAQTPGCRSLQPPPRRHEVSRCFLPALLRG